MPEPMTIDGHHLLCAVCARGGCPTMPDEAVLSPLLMAMWEDPYLPLRLTADVDATCAHFAAIAAGETTAPDDHVLRRKDLAVLRILGLAPGGVLPAFWAYRILFSRQPTLAGLCRTESAPSAAWPECPHARGGYYERIAGDGEVGNLSVQRELGEELAGRGLWAMVKPRTRGEMAAAKAASAARIMAAERLFIRPNHLLCILCTAVQDAPLAEDNLIELRRRMEADPSIPVTLTEGCCMVCDPCNVYDPRRHLCYHAHIKNSLRDLMILERLGLPPGATLPAGDLYALIYAKIEAQKTICGWGDGANTAPCWAPCGYDTPAYAEARAGGLLAGAIEHTPTPGR
jgi:hypothetical protein